MIEYIPAIMVAETIAIVGLATCLAITLRDNARLRANLKTSDEWTDALCGMRTAAYRERDAANKIRVAHANTIVVLKSKLARPKLTGGKRGQVTAL